MPSKIHAYIREWVRLTVYSIYEKVLNYVRPKKDFSRYFPLCHGKNYFYEPLKNENDDRIFFSKYHQSNNINPLAVDLGRFRCEIVSGTLNPAGVVHKIDLEEPSTIPVSISLEGRKKVQTLGDYSIDIMTDGVNRTLGKLVGDRFYYLPFHQAGSIELRSSQKLVVGDPLAFEKTGHRKKKLVVMLYVDSFTPEIFSYIDKEKDIPNITRFFSKGMSFANCYSLSEWTLPSVATIVSGRHPLRHGMFNARQDSEVGVGYPLLSERFRDAGYLTFQANPFWRTAPTHGYTKGYDRTIFKVDLSLEEALSLAYENIRAFPQRDQFLWLPFSEVHNHVGLLPDISAQVRLPLDGQDYSKQKRGPLRTESISQRHRYIEELKRLDFYLGQFFHFIEENYSEDEFLVALFADHGVRYLRDTPHLLATDLIHVPFYLRGGGVEARVSDELIETTDIAPTILALTDLPPFKGIDGRLPLTLGGGKSRTEAVTESYFPGRPYNASVKNKDYELFVVSEGLVDQNGQFDMGTPEISLYRLGDYSREMSSENEKVVTRLYNVLKNRLRETNEKSCPHNLLN